MPSWLESFQNKHYCIASLTAQFCHTPCPGFLFLLFQDVSVANLTHTSVFTVISWHYRCHLTDKAVTSEQSMSFWENLA